MTGYRAECVQAGVDGYLSKPIVMSTPIETPEAARTRSLTAASESGRSWRKAISGLIAPRRPSRRRNYRSRTPPRRVPSRPTCAPARPAGPAIATSPLAEVLFDWKYRNAG
jgi:hypothetical protein